MSLARRTFTAAALLLLGLASAQVRQIGGIGWERSEGQGGARPGSSTPLRVARKEAAFVDSPDCLGLHTVLENVPSVMHAM